MSRAAGRVLRAAGRVLRAAGRVLRAALLLLRGAALLPVLASPAGCAGDGAAGTGADVRTVAENVLTLQSGVVSELRERRGTGPFRTYEHPPATMVDAIAEAARRMRGLGGQPVGGVWVSHRAREVLAKERTPDLAASDAYDLPFRSAMIASVTPIPGAPNQSRVEIHAIHRGPFHRGAIAWERDLPPMVDQVLVERTVDRMIRPVRRLE